SDDQFWFTFFHEAGHLVLHSTDTLFLESAPVETVAEHAASKFAVDVLIPRAVQDELKTMPVTRSSIRHFALRNGISPGIVVGQLQFMGRARASHFNTLKTRYEWTD